MEAYESADSDLETRIIKAPDGLDYVVSMDVYFWNCLSTMESEGYSNLDEVVGIAWRGRAADAANGLHYSFPEALLVAINEMFEHYLTRIFGYANG